MFIKHTGFFLFNNTKSFNKRQKYYLSDLAIAGLIYSAKA